MKHWRVVYLAIPLTILVFLGIMCVNGQKSPELCDGIGRETAVYRTAVCADEAQTDDYELERYTEGQGEAPVWWDPEEDMAVEWTDNTTDNEWLSESNTQRVIDVGCPDYNIETTIYGWDGHRMESWEFGVFSRIFYLEFWQPNLTLCEAGCDAILRMWEMNGGTIYETLSHVNEDGSYAYSTFPGMWDETYDQDGLNWCTDFCMERFVNGPVWQAQYFRKGQYHDWGEWSPIPAYEICGIYFSVEKGW